MSSKASEVAETIMIVLMTHIDTHGGPAVGSETDDGTESNWIQDVNEEVISYSSMSGKEVAEFKVQTNDGRIFQVKVKEW